MTMGLQRSSSFGSARRRNERAVLQHQDDDMVDTLQLRPAMRGGLFKPRVHLAVRLPRSHMMMSGGSDKSIDGRGDSSDHRRQQRDWP